ncbi:MAG TPA: hypothetical protein VJ723_06745, partial [Candidatus Angelobacter sp.]|nr:hypothetical protein [Candidatus Angelobacter sp.]
PSRGEVPGDFGRKTSEAISNFHMHIGNYVWIIVCVVLLFVAVSLIFLYLFSRFRFILFDTVINKQAIIRRGWHQYGSQAGRYFVFWIVYTLLSWAALGVIVGVPLWHAYKSGAFHGDNALWSLLALIGSVILGLFLFALVSAIVRTFAQDFLVPLMALDDLGIGDGWSAIRQMVTREPGAWAGYLGIKLLLSIAAGIALSIVLLITGLFLCLILAIPVVVVVLVGVALMKAGTAGVVIAVVLFILAGLACLACLFCLTLTATAPVVVFFEAYSLYFFGGRYPRLGALLWPVVPTPQTREITSP